MRIRAGSSSWRSRRRFPGHLYPALAAVLGSVAAAAAQEGVPDAAPLGVLPAVDTASLAAGRHAAMETLLEKTIFQVDVLRLRLRVGTETAAELERVVAGRRFSDELADSVAAVMIRSRNVWARIVFERGVSLGQFLDGVLDNVRQAWRAGLIEEADYEAMAESLPVWFGFLEQRRIAKGDQLVYRIDAEGLRTIYLGVDGEVLLDQQDRGPGPSRILLGSYFAPGSDFRRGLVRSLLEAG